MAVHPSRGWRTAAAVVAAGATLLAGAAPAHGAQSGDIFIEVTPSTVAPGQEVHIRASCGTDRGPATVDSEPFGTVTLSRQGAFLSVAVVVRGDASAGTFTVRLRCFQGASKFATLDVVDMARPTRIPAGGGGTADTRGALDVPAGGVLLAGGVAALMLGLGLLLARRRAVPKP